MNKTIFISRHIGAREWAAQQGLAVDQLLAHLELDSIERGDKIVGTLPVHVVALICERGARYFHLSLDIPAHVRGRELSMEEMLKYGARIEEYVVRTADTAPGEKL